jgi:hypothetical protein
MGSCPAESQSNIRVFFFMDLLTFGMASALVMFLVACAIPRRDVGDRAAVAGQIYVSLWVSVLLLSIALGSGMGALWAGVLAVYPPEFANSDVWAPFALSGFAMLIAFICLIWRPLLLFPGGHALRKVFFGVRKPLQSLTGANPAAAAAPRRQSTQGLLPLHT